MSLFGCTYHISEKEKENTLQATNIFSKMTQEEMKNYIASALKNKYGLDCEISEINVNNYDLDSYENNISLTR